MLVRRFFNVFGIFLVEEARKETIEQFVAQHVDLSNLILDLTINEATGKPVLNETVEKLKDHVEKTKVLCPEDLIKVLDCLVAELAKSVPHRVLAGKINTLDILLKVIESEIDGGEVSHVENSVSH